MWIYPLQRGWPSRGHTLRRNWLLSHHASTVGSGNSWAPSSTMLEWWLVWSCTGLKQAVACCKFMGAVVRPVLSEDTVLPQSSQTSIQFYPSPPRHLSTTVPLLLFMQWFLSLGGRKCRIGYPWDWALHGCLLSSLRPVWISVLTPVHHKESSLMRSETVLICG